jgi:hypothetical protein
MRSRRRGWPNAMLGKVLRPVLGHRLLTHSPLVPTHVLVLIRCVAADQNRPT